MSQIEYEAHTGIDHHMADFDLHTRQPAAEILAYADQPPHIRWARKLGNFVRDSVETIQHKLSGARAVLGGLAVRETRIDPSVEGVHALRTVTEQDNEAMWRELESYYDPEQLAAIRREARGESQPAPAPETQENDKWAAINRQLGLSEEEMIRIRRAAEATRGFADTPQ